MPQRPPRQRLSSNAFVFREHRFLRLATNGLVGSTKEGSELVTTIRKYGRLQRFSKG
jgi:hypothetical protein